MLTCFFFSPIGCYARHRISWTVLTPVLLLFLTTTALGQDIIWSRTYGGSEGDFGWDVCQTSDSGYIMVGDTYSYGFDLQVYLVKTDANGDTLWTRVYGGSGLEQGLSVQQTSDGGYIVSGTTTSYGSGYQAYLIKTRSNGSLLWFRTYGGSDWENCPSVQQTTDGGYVLAGWTYSYGAGDADVYLIKTDSLGTLQWSRTYGGTRVDRGAHIEQTWDGGYIIVGQTRSFGIPTSNVYLIKTDAEGDTLWTRVYFPWGSYWNEGYSCQQTSDGGYIVSGLSIDQATGICHVYLIKTDANGDTLWTRLYGERYFSWGHSVRQTSDGGYIVVGSTQGDIYLIKTNPEGDTLWTRTYGDTAADVGRAVIQTTDGSYVVAGSTTSCGAPSADMCLLKISPFPLTILRGDANGDRAVEISDVVYIINYLLKNGPPPRPLLAGDTDCDGAVVLEDIIHLIRYLFQEGSELGCRCL